MNIKKSKCNTILTLLTALVCLGTEPSSGSTLSDVSNGMSQGTWAKLNTSGYTSNYLKYPGGNGQKTTQFLGNAVWDSISKKVLFLGAGHFDYSQLHIYTENTNTWTIGAAVPDSPRSLNHGYYHNAIDVGGRILGYTRLTNSRGDLFEYNISANSWTQKSSFTHDGDIAHAYVYFPERGIWYVADGTFGLIREYDRSSDSWSVLSQHRECFAGDNSVQTGYYHNFAEYSPTRKEIVFGGGLSQGGGGFTKSRALCKMTSNGTISRLPDAPVNLTVPSGGNSGSIITLDPQTGDLLVLAQDGNFYSFSFSSNSWSTINDGKPAAFSKTSNNVVEGWVAPISTYGVVMYANSNHEIWLYKHGAGNGNPVPPPPSPPIEPSVDTIPPSAPDQLTVVPTGVSTLPPPPAGTPFAELCQLSSTIFCQDFNQLPPNTASGVEGVFHNKGGCSSNSILGHSGRTCPELDNGTLKFIVPSQSGAGGSGQYYVNFANFNGGNSIKPGQELFVRWRQKFSANFLATKYQNSGGWKHGMLGAADEFSCASNEVVVQNSNQRGVPQMYHACGKFEGFEKKIGSFDFDYQPGGPATCLRSDIVNKNPPDYSKGCIAYYPNEWVTYQVSIKHGSAGQTSRIRMWHTRAGESKVLVIDYDKILRNTKGFGKMWLMPYQTGKDSSQVHPVGHVWYDQLIISRTELP